MLLDTYYSGRFKPIAEQIGGKILARGGPPQGAVIAINSAG